jgi:hypothetical protein
VGYPNDGSPDLIPRHDLAIAHRLSLPCKAQSSFPASRCRSLKGLAKDTAPPPKPPGAEGRANEEPADRLSVPGAVRGECRRRRARRKLSRNRR